MAIHNYLTVQELIEKYPEVENFNWTPQRLGVFYSGSLLLGKRTTKEGGSLLIAECSFFDLIHYSNQQLDKKKFNINLIK